MWRFEGGHQRSDVDGNDGDDDASQEDGGQFVDVLHAHKHQQAHQEETDGAVDTHVVQHGRTFTFKPLGVKDGCVRCYVHLEGDESETECNRDEEKTSPDQACSNKCNTLDNLIKK